MRPGSQNSGKKGFEEKKGLAVKNYQGSGPWKSNRTSSQSWWPRELNPQKFKPLKYEQNMNFL